jgi:hypothetical protein
MEYVQERITTLYDPTDPIVVPMTAPGENTRLSVWNDAPIVPAAMWEAARTDLGVVHG